MIGLKGGGGPPPFFKGPIGMKLLLLTGCLATFAASGAQAQARWPGAIDTTVIAGATSPVCTVETSSPTVTVRLDTRAQQQVTDVRYTCNTPGGFIRTISSANHGRLQRGDLGIRYRLSGAGADAIAFAPIDLDSAFVSTVASYPSLARGDTGMLSLSIAATPTRLLAGEYTDTITIDVTPN